MENKGAIWLNYVRTEIAPARLIHQLPGVVEIVSFVQRSAQIREDFIDGIIEQVVNPSDEGQLSALISGHQVQLCFLLNTVHRYFHQCENHPQFLGLYETVVADLQLGLSFIQQYFHKNFDHNALVPKPLIGSFLVAVETMETQVNASLQGSEADRVVGEAVLSEIKVLTGGALPFEQLSYLKEFLRGLPGVAVPGREPLSPLPRIAKYCIVKNFNATSFLHVCFKIFTERLSRLETGDEKREWLGQLYKYLSRLPVEQEQALHLPRPVVRDYLITWIEQELLSSQADQKKETITALEPIPKINTSVSVPVLALLTRVFKEGGIITNTNLQELFRSISAHYTSQRAESISPANFHGKYYTVEETTKRKVTDLLLEMVKVVRKIP